MFHLQDRDAEIEKHCFRIGCVCEKERGCWAIQVVEEYRYTTSFIMAFKPCEWNVMPFPPLLLHENIISKLVYDDALQKN